MTVLTPFETLELNEEKYIRQITSVLQRNMARDYPAGATLRDAHPRHLALLAATFTVAPDVPPELQIGVFAKPMTYDAWVRLSNASSTPQSDLHKDIRGCAIKLRHVGGAHIPESDEADTQDFLLVSMPTMSLGTLKLFRDAIVLSLGVSPLLFVAKMLLTGKGRMLKTLQRAKTNPASVLELRYWSTTPYLFGSQQVAKYSLVPTSDPRNDFPPVLTETYLVDDLEERLDAAEATFDFMVQLRRDPAHMPVEDAAVEWTEVQSAFIKVATLRIPPQEFRTEERAQLAEALAFSPGHARVEHRPIGAINRARMTIYKILSDFRHARDGRAKPV
ncbi:MAG: hypothetical protein EPO06_07685 [Burkholderiaceae bacterium]|nr:MAG: hypothetical protein EPO06_07685 [Burkholderiaceae bacterium]